MGARRNFSRGGQNHQHFKKLTRFRRAVQKIDHFSARPWRKQKIVSLFCDALDWNIEYLWGQLKARARMLGYFVGRQHITSFFQIQGGGASALPCPPPAGAYAHPCLGKTLPIWRRAFWIISFKMYIFCACCFSTLKYFWTTSPMPRRAFEIDIFEMYI